LFAAAKGPSFEVDFLQSAGRSFQPCCEKKIFGKARQGKATNFFGRTASRRFLASGEKGIFSG
jgi:hypothetical protein